MLPEYETVIADASCFILLDKLESLELLHSLFGDIVTTHEVASEYGKQLPDWVKIITPTANKNIYRLVMTLDEGEASAITLALEKAGCLLIIDDLKGRKIAQLLDIRITGSIGIIVKAKQAGIIKSVRPLLDGLRRTDFRFSQKIICEALKLSGEFEN